MSAILTIMSAWVLFVMCVWYVYVCLLSVGIYMCLCVSVCVWGGGEFDQDTCCAIGANRCVLLETQYCFVPHSLNSRFIIGLIGF